MPANLIEVFDTETQFIQDKLTSVGKPPLVWSQLCQCERDSLLAWLSVERSKVVIRRAV